MKERTVYAKHPKSEWWFVCRDDDPGKGIKGVLSNKDKWDVFGGLHAEVRLEEAVQEQVPEQVELTNG